MSGDQRLDTPFSARVSADGGAITVSVSGDVDLVTAPDLAELLPPIPSGGRMVLDLRDVSFMDSSGVRLLMTLDIRSRAEGWTLFVVAPDGAVRHVLDLCQVSKRVRLIDDPADAG